MRACPITGVRRCGDEWVNFEVTAPMPATMSAERLRPAAPGIRIGSVV